MRTINPKAWAILLEDEKMALNLQYAHNKSSWQSGEVMGKSHYKYLEIKYRAERFLKLFTQHLELFDEVIPEYVSGSREVKEYFMLTITQRKRVLEAYAILDETYGETAKAGREKEIITQMLKWEKSENAYDQTVYNLIKEFDRWNNFRILPQAIREPSAFKRRNKNLHKKHIRVTTQVAPISWELLEQIFKHRPGVKLLHLPVIIEGHTVRILRAKGTPKAIQEITSLNLYLFEDKAIAEEYINLLKEYVEPEKKKCRDGLIFWPKYREIIKKAINYEGVQKIVPTRKYLELAMAKLNYI